MSATKPSVYKRGNYVKIISPYEFVRCGYPLCIDDGLAYVEARKPEVLAFFQTFYATEPEHSLNDFGWESTYQKARRELAHLYIKGQSYGGNQRQIITKHRPELLYKTACVISKTVVVTGKREPGYFSSYDGDFTSPYLTHEKRHVILEVDLITTNDTLHDNTGFIRIEACNVNRFTEAVI